MANVFKIQYETKKDKDTSWNAFILANSLDEAKNHLLKRVGPFKINEVENICRLDAITEEISKLISDNYNKSSKDVKENKKPIKKVTKEEENAEV